MATLKDIAKELGLSPSTVSRALTGQRYVDEATRAAVQDAAERLGYRPNAAARSLRRQSTRTIGLVMPSIISTFNAASATAVHDAAERSGYQTMLCITDDDPVREKDCFDTLAANNVAGIIYAPSSDYGVADWDSDIPVVEIGRQSSGRRFDSVSANSQEGAEELIRHLVDYGHEKIAVAAGPLDLSPARSSVNGYKSVLGVYGIPVIEEYIKAGGPSKEWGHQATDELLAMAERPTAIFATGAQLALGVFEALYEAGLSCPDDMSVVAFQDPTWFRVWKPGITAYSVPMTQIGRLAWQLLQSRIEAGPGNSRASDITTTQLSGVLQVRNSVRKLSGL
jgi:DNA-binding LacI/PurR family transcriptional regulator